VNLLVGGKRLLDVWYDTPRAAISGGCEAAMVRLAAQQLQLVAGAMRAVMASHGIDIATPAVAKELADRLRSIDVDVVEDEEDG
jgi:hypothetical protein